MNLGFRRRDDDGSAGVAIDCKGLLGMRVSLGLEFRVLEGDGDA